MQGVQHRAVAGELVVLVEHMQAEGAVEVQWFIASKAIRVSRRSMASWVISSSWTQCGQPHRTWPSRSSARSSGSGLGSRTTSHSAMSCSRERSPADVRRQLLVGHAEALAVALLEEDPRAQVGVDPLDVRGWIGSRRSFSLRDGDDAEAELVHRASL